MTTYQHILIILDTFEIIFIGALFGPGTAVPPQVSTHVGLDHQTYSALAQHTQITWTAVLKCDEPSRVGR